MYIAVNPTLVDPASLGGVPSMFFFFFFSSIESFSSMPHAISEVWEWVKFVLKITAQTP